MQSTATKLARLSVAFTPPVARIALTHPPLNVIDIAMMEQLAEALVEIEARADLATIVLHGESNAFSSGVDVAAHAPERVGQMLQKFHAVILALLATTKVTMAAVHGLCLGGGAELAMICDMVYTTESAQWGFPEIKLGCFPPVACAVLASLVGQKRAAGLILTGRTISGKEAAEFGLATRAVVDAELEYAVAECVERLVKLSPAALKITKKASYAWNATHFDKGLARAEKVYLEDLMKTADAQEGIRAFMEKREPRWSGR